MSISGSLFNAYSGLKSAARTAEAISNIETGKSLPSIDTLLALAAALGVGVADFLPTGELRHKVAATRMKREAEVMQLIRGLSD